MSNFNIGTTQNIVKFEGDSEAIWLPSIDTKQETWFSPASWDEDEWEDEVGIPIGTVTEDDDGEEWTHQGSGRWTGPKVCVETTSTIIKKLRTIMTNARWRGRRKTMATKWLVQLCTVVDATLLEELTTFCANLGPSITFRDLRVNFMRFRGLPSDVNGHIMSFLKPAKNAGEEVIHGIRQRLNDFEWEMCVRIEAEDCFEKVDEDTVQIAVIKDSLKYLLPECSRCHAGNPLSSFLLQQQQAHQVKGANLCDTCYLREEKY